MPIGQLLRQARIAAGLTQKVAAKRARFSAPTLCNIEQADDVFWSTVVKLCKVYGITVAELVAPRKEGV